MLYYLVCFDIEDHRYRRRLGKRLLAYGHRVQRSVFEIGLPGEQELHRLRAAILRLQAEHEETGNIRFYRMLKPCREASFAVDGEPVMVFPTTWVV